MKRKPYAILTVNQHFMVKKFIKYNDYTLKRN